MNEITSPPLPYSRHLRALHSLCAVSAFGSVILTALRALKSGPGEGLGIIAYAAFTLAFAHAALFLSRRVYSPTENSGRFLNFFALVIGYLAVASGISSLLSK